MSLDNLININISLSTQSIETKGFGTPLILAITEDIDLGDVNTYTSIEGVGEDFADTTEVYKMAQSLFSQEFKPQQIKVARRESGDTPSAALTKVINTDNDWYGLLIPEIDEVTILAYAAALETREKIFLCRSKDIGIPDGGVSNDVLSQLGALGYVRTGLVYHSDADVYYPDAAILGKQLPKDPGSTNWAFQTLVGVPADRNITEGQRVALLAKNANFIEKNNGRTYLFNGKMVGNEFIDVIRGRDWIKARIQESIFSKQIDLEKIEYTDIGIGTLENLVNAVLLRASSQGIITDDFTIKTVSAKDTPENDRRSRVYKGLSFTATVRGAINELEITGNIGA